MFHVLAFNPHPLLRNCVDSYLFVSSGRPEEDYVENNFLPHTSQSLVFSLTPGIIIYNCMLSEVCSPHFIMGPNDQVIRLRLDTGLKNAVISFKPGGLYKLFRLSAYFFSNRIRNAVEFLGNQVLEIADELAKLPVAGNIELLDGWLIRQMQKQKKSEKDIDEAIRLVERFKGNITVRELSQATFTTKRTLERRFQEQVGLHPKTFSRLVRFNGVIRQVESCGKVKWRQLSESYGYYDQSHFIHEFKSLTGGLPQEYSSQSVRFEKFL
jgi:AraC-like DNA-binding protein